MRKRQSERNAALDDARNELCVMSNAISCVLRTIIIIAEGSLN